MQVQQHYHQPIPTQNFYLFPKHLLLALLNPRDIRRYNHATLSAFILSNPHQPGKRYPLFFESHRPREHLSCQEHKHPTCPYLLHSNGFLHPYALKVVTIRNWQGFTPSFFFFRTWHLSEIIFRGGSFHPTLRPHSFASYDTYVIQWQHSSIYW